jgi:hypothetical protein
MEMLKKYSSLNDASVTNPHLAFGNMKIWFMKEGVSRDLGMGYTFCKKYNLLPLTTEIEKTHTLVGRIDCASNDEAFCALQGESWSPNGEARDLIKSLGLYHTSMSVGDIIEQEGKFFFCDNYGFTELK